MQQRLDLAPDRLAQDRRGAVRRDADHHRRTVDDRAELEIAEGRLVDHVHRHARIARGGRKGLRLLLVFEVGDCERGILEDIGRPRRAVQRERTVRTAARQQGFHLG